MCLFDYRNTAVLFNSATLQGLQPNEGALLHPGYFPGLKGNEIVHSGNTLLEYKIELHSLRLGKAVGRNFRPRMS